MKTFEKMTFYPGPFQENWSEDELNEGYEVAPWLTRS